MSQQHSATKKSSRNPAKICGVPNLSRVKNVPIGRSDCFTMSRHVAESGMDPTSNGLSRPPALKPANESTIHQIFIGPQGLRSGWRFVIYVVAFVALTLAFSQITR